MNSAAQPARSGLPRAVKLFGLVSLLNDFASEMIYPLLPAFVTGVLGAGAGALGALDGAAEFAAAGVKWGAGRLADRPARRGRLVVLGYAMAVLVRPVISLAGAAWQVIGLRVVQGVFGALLQPATLGVLRAAFPPDRLGMPIAVRRAIPIRARPPLRSDRDDVGKRLSLCRWHEAVRATLHGLHPFRFVANGYARHAQPIGLPLESTRVCHDHSGPSGESDALEVADRRGHSHASVRGYADLLESRGGAWMGSQ